MPVRRPQELTLSHIAKDMGVSLILALGTVVIEVVRAIWPMPILPAGTLLALELALVCFALGYAIRAVAFLFDQILFLVAKVNSTPHGQVFLSVLISVGQIVKWLSVGTIVLAILALVLIAVAGLAEPELFFSVLLELRAALNDKCLTCGSAVTVLSFPPMSAILVSIPLSLILGARLLSLVLQRKAMASAGHGGAGHAGHGVTH